MAKIKGNYETIFIVNPTIGEETIRSVVEKFKKLIEDNGTIEKLDEWGRRRLAYPIEDLNEGYYIFVSFTSDPSFPAELDRIYNITDGIMRSLVITNN